MNWYKSNTPWDKKIKIILGGLGSVTFFSIIIMNILRGQERLSPSPIMNNQSLTKIELDKPGLYLATTTLEYDDGDVLKGDFRVYCPTSTIRPTNYVLLDKYGHVKKQGQWWESAFEAQYLPEKMLITLVFHPKS